MSQTSSTIPTAAPPAWLSIEGRKLVAEGRPVQLRGIGLGNWMLVEHFMIGLPQVDYIQRQAFADVLGPERAAAFWDAYMASYFSDADFAAIKALGFNHVRVPFSYRHFESDAAPGVWREEGFRLLDRTIDACKRHGLWALLDLHSAPGCQASDWNAESAFGEAFLWDTDDYQRRMAALWGEMARRYKDEPTVMAYEVLNEPVTLFPHQVDAMNRFHHRCISAIREQDQKHIIVINGDKHATDLRALDDETFSDPQVMAAFHFYYGNPALRELKDFPGEVNGEKIDMDFVVRTGGLDKRANRERIARPEFLDEFGTHYDREGTGINRKVIGGIIRWCEQTGTHWNLWHWKDVNGMGLVRMKEGTLWLQLLEKIGSREMQNKGRDAVNAYMTQVQEFLPLEGKYRGRLWSETRRDLETQMLWVLVGRMKNLTAEELAALGASFTYENFEIDEQMGAILQDIMK